MAPQVIQMWSEKDIVYQTDIIQMHLCGVDLSNQLTKEGNHELTSSTEDILKKYYNNNIFMTYNLSELHLIKDISFQTAIT